VLVNQIEAKWYETFYRPKKLVKEIQDISSYLDTHKVEIQEANENERRTADLIKNVTSILGKYTGYGGNEYGWCIYLNDETCVKFVIDELKDPSKKTITHKTKRAEETEWALKMINGKELLKLVKSYFKKQSVKKISPEPRLPNVNNISPERSLPTVNNISSEPRLPTVNNISSEPRLPTVNNISSEARLSKVDLDRIKRVLYISTPKYKRIEYQTCIKYEKYRYLMELKE
jgi:hypothetical protein